MARIRIAYGKVEQEAHEHEVQRLRGVVVGVACLLAGAAQAAASKPNILVIWGDDIGGCNSSACNQGVMGYRTPDIDSIAREGALHC